jgi:hypothetical protein
LRTSNSESIERDKKERQQLNLTGTVSSEFLLFRVGIHGQKNRKTCCPFSKNRDFGFISRKCV